MRSGLYESALRDPAVYENCLLFTRELLESVFEMNGQVGRWILMPEPMYGNGRPIREGNPLVAYWHKVFGRAVRVILVDHTETNIDYSAFVAEDNLEPALPPMELVVSFFPTDESYDYLRKLLIAWAVDLRSVNQMRSLLE